MLPRESKQAGRRAGLANVPAQTTQTNFPPQNGLTRRTKAYVSLLWERWHRRYASVRARPGEDWARGRAEGR